ncbi:MAG: hypothetical protein ING52_05890 [Burkholderiales bacterium]|jgi:hypothetical protein|nr:hypothetical protein [Burkholderiales bacterium]MCE2646581.1 hypothetical protein [Burkholderiaceae bacterium]
MRVSCPSCGADLSLDVLVAHDGARRAVAAALQLSAPLAHRVMHYIALFRPAQRQLTMDRVATLLDDLLPLVRDQRVERNGNRYDTTTADWTAALDQVLANRDAGLIRLPLKSHGYLLAILVEQREKVFRADETRREAERRSPHRPLPPAAPVSDSAAATAPMALPSYPALPPVNGPRQVPTQVFEHLQRLGLRRRKGADAAVDADTGTDNHEVST